MVTKAEENFCKTLNILYLSSYLRLVSGPHYDLYTLIAFKIYSMLNNNRKLNNYAAVNYKLQKLKYTEV